MYFVQITTVLLGPSPPNIQRVKNTSFIANVFWHLVATRGIARINWKRQSDVYKEPQTRTPELHLDYIFRAFYFTFPQLLFASNSFMTSPNLTRISICRDKKWRFWTSQFWKSRDGSPAPGTERKSRARDAGRCQHPCGMFGSVWKILCHDSGGITVRPARISAAFIGAWHESATCTNDFDLSPSAKAFVAPSNNGALYFCLKNDIYFFKCVFDVHGLGFV